MIGTVIKRGFGLLSRRGPRSDWEATMRRGIATEILYEDDSVVVIHRPGAADATDCIVSFTGIGRAMGGIDLQTPEFSRSGTDARKVFVIDRNRSWGTGIDWDLIARLVRGVAGIDERIVTLGNSMGGFLAIAAAQHLGAEQAVAFAPQWSVHPEAVPFETRWTAYREAIRDWPIRDLGPALATPSCRFHLVFGDDPLDRAHLARFPAPRRRRLETCLVAGGGHEVAAFLKAEGLLYTVIDACLAGLSAGAVLRAAGVAAEG